MRVALIALSLLTTTAWAEGTTVATLLPPPVEAFSTAKTAETVAVPVLKQAIQKGETITADNVTLLEIPASQAFASTVVDSAALVGQQAQRPLAAGAPVNRLHVRVAPAVTRNQSVTIMYRKGGIELSGRGQAMEDGQIGQSIRVVNPSTRSTVIGTIAEGGIVEVN